MVFELAQVFGEWMHKSLVIYMYIVDKELYDANNFFNQNNGSRRITKKMLQLNLVDMRKRTSQGNKRSFAVHGNRRYSVYSMNGLFKKMSDAAYIFLMS